MNELIHIVEAILGSSVVCSSVTFLWARKKYLSEVKTNDLENLRKMLQLYIDIVEDNKKRLDDYQSKLECSNKKVAELTDETISLRQEVKELKLENNELRTKLSNLNL